MSEAVVALIHLWGCVVVSAAIVWMLWQELYRSEHLTAVRHKDF